MVAGDEKPCGKLPCITSNSQTRHPVMATDIAVAYYQRIIAILDQKSSFNNITGPC
jgi:hypothetical protein